MPTTHPHMPFPPVLHDDGAMTAVVTQPPQLLDGAWLMTVSLPPALTLTPRGGQFVLARSGAQSEFERAEHWPTALRTPLYVASSRTAVLLAGVAPTGLEWELAIPVHGYDDNQWVRQLMVGARLNLLGPLGQGFFAQPQARNLLLLADAARLPLLFAIMEQMLDQGGRVTLVLRADTLAADLRSRLPIPVELRLATTDHEFAQQLPDTMRWADQVAAALPNDAYAMLVEPIRAARFRLEPGFAHASVEADLACGVGACLACAVPLPDGSRTRACVHGPVFDLAALLGR